jgi:PTS system fructose-specific IIC component
VTGALIMAFDVTIKAPHGGIFVFFAIGNLVWFLVSLAAGTIVGAVAVVAAKQFAKNKVGADSAPELVAA